MQQANRKQENYAHFNKRVSPNARRKDLHENHAKRGELADAFSTSSEIFSLNVEVADQINIPHVIQSEHKVLYAQYI